MKHPHLFKACLTLLFAAWPMLFCLADEPTSLHIIFSDGSHSWFLFESSPEITFTEDKMTVTTATATTSFSFDSIKEYCFDNGPTGIQQQGQNSPNVMRLGDDAILIEGIKSDIVALYDLSGRQLSAHVQQQSNGVKVSLRSLPSGAYIIRLNKQSIKVTKK